MASFAFSKAELVRKQEYYIKLQSERESLDQLIEDTNDAITTALEKLNDELSKYNDLRNEIRGFIEDIHSQADEDYNDKSERWQEGERGCDVSEWMNSLLDLVNGVEDIEPVELDKLDPLEHDSLLSDMDELPDAAGE